jgi:hypothetical protein
VIKKQDQQRVFYRVLTGTGFLLDAPFFGIDYVMASRHNAITLLANPS